MFYFFSEKISTLNDIQIRKTERNRCSCVHLKEKKKPKILEKFFLSLIYSKITRKKTKLTTLFFALRD